MRLLDQPLNIEQKKFKEPFNKDDLSTSAHKEGFAPSNSPVNPEVLIAFATDQTCYWVEKSCFKNLC